MILTRDRWILTRPAPPIRTFQERSGIDHTSTGLPLPFTEQPVASQVTVRASTSRSLSVMSAEIQSVWRKAMGSSNSTICPMDKLVTLWRECERSNANGEWHEDHAVQVAASHVWSHPDGLNFSEFLRLLTKPPWNSLLSDEASQHHKNLQVKERELNVSASGPEVAGPTPLHLREFHPESMEMQLLKEFKSGHRLDLALDKLSDSQLNSLLLKKFKQLDADNSGYLEGEELKELLVFALQFCAKPGINPAKLRQDAEHIIAEDIGDDKALDFGEFIAVWNHLLDAFLGAKPTGKIDLNAAAAKFKVSYSPLLSY